MTNVVDGCDLPDGQYLGKWGGYSVRVEADGQVHTMQTKDGVRGMNIPCTVSVSKGQATVEVNR